MRYFTISLPLVVLALMTGCAETSDVTSDATSEFPDDSLGDAILTSSNTHCPIMGHEVSPDGGSTQWKDKTIGFCCEGCIDDWNELTEEQKAAKLAEADKAGGDQHKDHGEAHKDEAAG